MFKLGLPNKIGDFKGIRKQLTRKKAPYSGALLTIKVMMV
jgi:hypothetical protein